MAGKKAVKLTYKDYLQYPDDGKRHEIINGDHYMTPSPNSYHQYYSKKIVFQMENHLINTEQGVVFYAPLGVILSDNDIIQPDIIFVSYNNIQIIKEPGIFGSPDLVIEILSQSTRSRDKGLKMDIYAKYSIPEYWIVDSEEKIIFLYRLDGNKYKREQVSDKTLSTISIPGFVLDLNDVFSTPF